MRNLISTIIAGLILFVATGCPTASSDTSPPSRDLFTIQDENSPEAAEDQADIEDMKEDDGLTAIGETVNVGSMDWTVVGLGWRNSVEVGSRIVEAAGIYLELEITVELVEEDFGHLDQGQVFVEDGLSRRFYPHGDSYILAEDGLLAYPANPDTFIGENIITRDVEARMPITGKMLFDLPTDVNDLRFVINDQRDLSEMVLFRRISDAVGEVRIESDGMKVSK